MVLLYFTKKKYEERYPHIKIEVKILTDKLLHLIEDDFRNLSFEMIVRSKNISQFRIDENTVMIVESERSVSKTRAHNLQFCFTVNVNSVPVGESLAALINFTT